MTEELESFSEKLEEDIHHAAEHAKEDWLKWSALFSALFAVMAAISGLSASHYANQAMIEQIRSSDEWSHYQAKVIKALVAETGRDIVAKLDDTDAVPPQQAKVEKYRNDQEEIHKKAEELEKASERHLEQHETLAKSVTFFQVAIALIAITVLTRKRYFLLVAIALGLTGSVFLALGSILF